MKTIKIIICVVFIVLLTSMSRSKNPVIYVVGINHPLKSDIELVKNNLKTFYRCDVFILKTINIPKSIKVNGTDKYQSVKIVEYLNDRYQNIDGKVIGVTNVDICTDRVLNGKVNKNWGIFGLSILGKQSSIVSTKRLKFNHNNRLKKVSVHEVGHSLGIPHCESNYPCLMKDAKGKGSKVDKELLWMCDDCKNKIKH
jgi:archaemetzincin